MNLIPQKEIENRIFTIRGLQVMMDSHLADLYGVETKVFNQAVKRNVDRFPASFRFQLTEHEWSDLRSQIVTSSSEHGGRRYLPYVFTEQGVAMLSAVLKSDVAVKVSIQIMNAFVNMRKMMIMNASLFQRLDTLELKQIETDQKLDADKHNTQYPPVKLKEFKADHDRFLIIDNTALYHIGSSLKDLGKKWFAFSKMDMGAFDVLKRLEEVN